VGTRSRICPIYIYYLLHRELQVSALGTGHLQVVYETLSMQLYKTYIYMDYLHGVGRGLSGHEISYLT
jgi:hypothetical protein